MFDGVDRARLAVRKRPSRADVEPAALDLLQRHGASMLAAARRFAATPEDAEDAYQRGVEILLTKAPTIAEEELLPWLRTVIKHEAWALARHRQRVAPVADDGYVPEPLSEPGLTHAQAERLDRLRMGAEAFGHLKPQEVRALLLRAEGYTYKQIQEITGWSYTKVNRCLTEGRRAFQARVAGIERGRECERMSPLLSKLVDGEASAEDLKTLRPHMRTCLACRATLREYRAAPATAAALAAEPSQSPLGDVAARVAESMSGWVQKGHAAVEMASAQKLAALAASTAVLAGGGAATVAELEEGGAERAAHARAAGAGVRASAAEPAPPAVVEPAPGGAPATADPRPPSTAELRRARELARRSRAEQRARAVERRTPPSHQEFEPAWAADEPARSPEPAPAASAASTAAPAAADPDPHPARSRSPNGAGAEEFAP